MSICIPFIRWWVCLLQYHGNKQPFFTFSITWTSSSQQLTLYFTDLQMCTDHLKELLTDTFDGISLAIRTRSMTWTVTWPRGTSVSNNNNNYYYSCYNLLHLQRLLMESLWWSYFRRGCKEAAGNKAMEWQEILHEDPTFSCWRTDEKLVINSKGRFESSKFWWLTCPPDFVTTALRAATQLVDRL
jgi:hypothetical protein